MFTNKDKEAYMQAKERCPKLIETESPPLNFLIYCGFDIWKAAYQLLMYWKLRKASTDCPIIYNIIGLLVRLCLHGAGTGA